ncbi:MAG TPA: amidohydrolase family protein [Gemmatimonadaceae bacterium]|nr:amidohydrolase family protein [Gemmatimonadaceae bacterium]
MSRLSFRVATCLLLAAPGVVAAQTPVDSALVTYIASIRAIDNHAHPMRPVRDGAPADSEFDALPLDGIPPFPLPWRLRLDNPEWRAAQTALFDISTSGAGTDDAFRTALHARRAEELKSRGDDYPAWVLDRAGIDVMLANRIALGPGLAPPRFRWVAFDDALLFPIDTRSEAERTPDTRSLYPKEQTLLRRYMRELNVTKLPATLDGYVANVLRPTLVRQHREGAIAVKFEAAYLRPLDFGDANVAEARRVYAKYVLSGVPTHAEYKTLEDYLFKEVAREAGRQGMPVHIHTLDTFGGFYSSRGSAPHLLEPTFNDSTLRGTSFVMIHGGWPLYAQTQSMLSKPNVYADISMMVLVAEPRELATTLRSWLTAWPEKVLFGTDAFDGGPDQGWEEGVWLGATSARRALALALTGMMRDGEIDRPRAEALARMVLHDNAAKLYGTSLASR